MLYFSTFKQVVDTNTVWLGGFAAINAFGFGGSNCYAVLKSEEPQSEVSFQNPPTFLCRNFGS